MKNTYKLIVVFILTVGIFGMSASRAHAELKADNASLKTCIQLFCEKMYGSMLADSSTSFSKDDFLTVDGYLTAKVFEAKRDYEQIDVPGGFTYVKITDVIIKGMEQEKKGDICVTARIKCDYVSGDEASYWGNDYQFTVRVEGESLSVVDVKALEGDEFLNIRDSLPLWQEKCSYAGEDWEYEAIDLILDNKKFDVKDLVQIDKIEPEPEAPDRVVNSEEGTKSITVSYNTYTHSVFFHTSGTNYIQDAADLYVCQHTSYNPHRRLSAIIRSYSANDPDNTPCYMRRMRFYNGVFNS